MNARRGRGWRDKDNEGQVAPGVNAIAMAGASYRSPVTSRWQGTSASARSGLFTSPRPPPACQSPSSDWPRCLVLYAVPQSCARVLAHPFITHPVIQKQTMHVSILCKNTRSAASSAVHPTTLASNWEHGER